MGSGKTCVIVGYGPGVGAAVTDAFASEAYSLALIARDARKLSRAADALRARGVVARGYPADVGEPEGLTAALDQARREGGDPEILVYNAAAFRPGPTLATEPRALAEDFAVSVTGALVAAHKRPTKPEIIFDGQGPAGFSAD